jgi:hypothetical protein
MNLFILFYILICFCFFCVFSLGTGWNCINGTISFLLPVSACVSFGLPTPPLGLYECIPLPDYTDTIIYASVGTPILMGIIMGMLYKHRQLLGSNDFWNGKYGEWNLLFTDPLKKKLYLHSRWLYYLRYLELRHSFLCK